MNTRMRVVMPLLCAALLGIFVFSLLYGSRMA